MIDLTGQKFGRLTVRERRGTRNDGSAMWLCECDCGNTCVATGYRLRNGHTKSCGCYKTDRIRETHKKINQYIVKDDYIIGIANNTGKEFIIDKNDYEKIKNYGWFENDQGYILATINKKGVRIHRFIIDCNKDDCVDHINGDKADNRKANLRIATKQQNGFNRGCTKANKTGVKGVYPSPVKGKYVSSISMDGKTMYLGTFDSIEEASKARRKAEKELFKDFAYAGGDNT